MIRLSEDNFCNQHYYVYTNAGILDKKVNRRIQNTQNDLYIVTILQNDVKASEIDGRDV